MKILKDKMLKFLIYGGQNVRGETIGTPNLQKKINVRANCDF